jgi:hypothetical protein
MNSASGFAVPSNALGHCVGSSAREKGQRAAARDPNRLQLAFACPKCIHI